MALKADTSRASGLLLLHAFPLDDSMWAPQVEEFASWTTVLAPEFPGFGGAEPPVAPSMDSAADIAAEEVREAGLQRVVVCGLSMGGYVALAFWRRHPDLVAGMVFANTRATADDDAGREARRVLARRLREEGQAFLANDPPPLLSDTASGELLTFVKNTIASQPAEAIAGAAEAMADRPDSTADLAGITVPTLVITGSADTLIPPDATRQLADGLPNTRFEVIDRAGHLSNLEAPHEFNRLLRDHLVRCNVIIEGLPAGVRTGPA
ncbi:MAG: alpha/beta fold hydrolase [Hyphomicrobiales bacterium]